MPEIFGPALGLSEVNLNTLCCSLGGPPHPVIVVYSRNIVGP